MQLTICEFNIENLFISLDFYQGESLESLSEDQWKKLAIPQMRHKQKSLKKLWGLANAIHDIQPHILMLIEVGGKDSLEHFNTFFLAKNYVPHFIESNSKRGIDLAFLVHKDLPFEAKTFSNKETAVEVDTYQGKYKSRFSRDVAELRLSRGHEMKLILLLTHLKSKISTDQDFQGKDMRKAEASALSQLYKKIRTTHPQTPLVVGGDFNAELSSPELELITQTDLTDFHELLETPYEERISLVHFDYKGEPHPQILDYLLISPDLKKKLVKEKSYTYRYKSFYDIPHPLPRTMLHRYQMPSDHYPLVLTLEID